MNPLPRHRISEYENLVGKLFSNSYFKSGDRAVYVYDTSLLDVRLQHFKESYPSGTLHAVAIKSNSHPKVLRHIIDRGHGLEAASFEEVRLAVEAGCPYEKIVFDSPVKTKEEIRLCDSELPGLILNANCFEELDRLKATQNLRIGIRINPMIDIGSPEIYNVSGKHSKFGIPIQFEERIIKYALNLNQCKGLHIHAGSEIGNKRNHIKAISRVVQLAEEIRKRAKKLDFIDIGGGISPATPGEEEPGIGDFFQKLVASSPEILDYQIITEYGRLTHTHNAFVLSEIEYVLKELEPNIALIHVGADLFPREIYSSHPPAHEYYIVDPVGNIKTRNEQKYHIGGPLCFSGDFIKRNVNLPAIHEGDLILITDTGSNTLSMWSQHCSRKKIRTIIL